MILVGDNRATLPTIERGSVQCVATSPPYFGLRLYGEDGAEIGKEVTLALYLDSLRDVMRLCWNALRARRRSFSAMGMASLSLAKVLLPVRP